MTELFFFSVMFSSLFCYNVVIFDSIALSTCKYFLWLEHNPVSQKCLRDSIQACEVSGYDSQLFIPFFWHITQRMGKWEKVYHYCSFVVILIKNDKLGMDCRGVLLLHVRIILQTVMELIQELLTFFPLICFINIPNQRNM